MRVAAGLIDRDPVLALQKLDDEEACPPDRRDFAWRYYRQLGQRQVRRFVPCEGGISNAALRPMAS